MNSAKQLKLLFIINPNSGNKTINFHDSIKEYFKDYALELVLFDLPANCSSEEIKKKIKDEDPSKVIAVGGDGTVKLVAECLLQTNIPLGILPAGSANGMAKELSVSVNITDALDTIVNGVPKKIHLVQVNEELCIHLSDIGFNAYVVKTFEAFDKRGMWSYMKAAWKVLRRNPLMDVRIQIDDAFVQREAEMVVIANATKYGTGVLINPAGSLEDDLFEVIIVKQISLIEIFKMKFTHAPYHPKKTELLQTRDLKIKSKHKVHFQVDGEYLGKVNNVTASIVPDALHILVPQGNK
jgi:YegS/Rv2252/BmrU family lipid kinase